MANNSEVAHRWAQDDPNVRTIQSGHMSFQREADEDQVLFSYRTPIATIVSTPSGERVALVTTRGHSSSTARHTSEALGAIGRQRVFQVPNVRPTPKGHHENVEAFLKKAGELYARVPKARTRGASLLEQARRTLNHAEQYAQAFDIPFERPELDDVARVVEERAAAEKKRHAKELAAAKRAQKRRERAQRIEDKSRFERWLEGSAQEWCPASYRVDEHGSSYLRRVDDLDEVQTSGGARVPWKQALRLYQFAKRCRDAAEGWHNVEERRVYVGIYKLDSVTAEGNVTIGCHFLSWERMHELAVRERVADTDTAMDILDQNVPVEAE